VLVSAAPTVLIIVGRQKTESSGGWLLVEVSPDLARSVRGILIKAGYVGDKSHPDRVGATRVVAGRFQG
jgi:hypothetical protein